ncbi:MAG: GH92 family glycosyl hydrolase [Verrucomicrobiota bacterium]|nr:GH92 family glycosyl hydrolase [Verrucomicrobiota bacterium]
MHSNFVRRLVLGLLLAALVKGRAVAGERPVDLANPLVGTAPLDRQKWIGNAPPPGEELYTGFVWPGPALPHRSPTCGPLNKDLAEAAGNHGIRWPYTYPRRTMIGFSSIVPGMTLMPLAGDWTVPPDRSYASVYDKDSEHASPGYYTVYFPDYQIKSELTTTAHTAFYRFTFPKTDKGVVLLDLGPRDASVEIIGDHAIRGQAARGGRGDRSARYFIAEFSKPFKSFGTFRQEVPALDGGWVRRTDVTRPDSRSESGSYAGCYLNFSTTAGEQILVKVAAGQSLEQADQQLKSENPGWDFDGVKAAAAKIWNKKLSLIEVRGGTEQERRFFYSAFYHALSSPRLLARRGEPFRGLDGEIHTGDYDRYSGVPFWDTGRDQIVLLMLLEPELMTNVLRTHLEMARESGWMSTSFHGDNAVFLYLGAWERGYQFDWGAAYDYLRKNATDPRGPRGHLAEYLQRGWIHDIVVPNPSPPYADGNAGVATTLEYAWDDYDLALYAKKLGRLDDYEMFLARAHDYTNVFDPAIGFMRGRNADGSWISPFDPREPYYNFMMKEANGWQTLWLVPQDVAGLIRLLGGRQKFCAKLDEFFTLPYHPKGIARDVTGLIGQYCQGNQPDWQAPYFYDYAGEPWKTQALVRKILRELYGSDPAGLPYPGMDDQGATSAWYVLSALGFYPVNPARPEYIIGSPVFDRVTLRLGNGKDFVIVARNNSGKNVFIQSARLNGRPLDRPWFSHADIVNGGRLEFEMGPRPNKNWGSAPDAAPPSMSNEN